MKKTGKCNVQANEHDPRHNVPIYLRTSYTAL